MKNILLFASFLVISGFAGHKLVKTKVYDGIVVALPAELKPMTSDDLVLRYPSVRAPLAAYTDDNRTLDFSVNTSATQWPDADAELAKKFFKSGFYNLYDRIDMIDEGEFLSHKKKFIFYEFESRVNGNRMKEGEQAPVFRYTYIMFLIEPKRTLVFSFNCPKGMREDWQEIVRAMMKSVNVK